MLADYEQQVRRTEQMRTVARLGASLAHEMRNAATGCRMAVDLHAEECPAAADDESLAVARRQLRLMENQLQRFLQVGRQPTEVVRGEVDLARVVDDLLPLVRPAVRHAKVELDWRPADEELFVLGDEDALSQVRAQPDPQRHRSRAARARQRRRALTRRVTRASCTVATEHDARRARRQRHRPGPRRGIGRLDFRAVRHQQGRGRRPRAWPSPSKSSRPTAATIAWSRSAGLTRFRVTLPAVAKGAAVLPRILVVDDEPSICWGLSRLARAMGHRVDAASSAEQGLALAAAARPDLVVLDVRLPGMDGLTAMESFRRHIGAAPIIVMTAFGDLATAVRAVDNGAFEYVVKPFDLAEIRAAIERALRDQPAAGESTRSSADDEPSGGVDGMLGRTPAMQAVFKRIALAAASDASVLLHGESGVGKELAARAIHRHSARRDAPFVAVNVAALNPALAEAELFGHVAGAFAGAGQARKGLLVQADGGTLFLDEVADIPLPVAGEAAASARPRRSTARRRRRARDDAVSASSRRRTRTSASACRPARSATTCSSASARSKLARSALVVVFEGPDAAGKGGAIKRIVERLDPRLLRVHSIVKPTAEEYQHHYMWRFWNKLPPYGQIVVFDRSWYGRVLVERVEGFATEKEWKRGYQEINEFERCPLQRWRRPRQMLSAHFKGGAARTLSPAGSGSLQTLENQRGGLAQPAQVG